MSDQRPTEVRLRTAKAWDKALRQYQELRRTRGMRTGIIIAEMADGAIQILGQGMTPGEMAPLLAVAAEGLVAADQQRPGAGVHSIRLEPHEEPEKRGEHNRSKPREKEITTADDGTLVPPPGENFISCGECNHPRWYVLHHNADDSPARLACAHCGNEVKMLRVTHPEGHA